MSKAASSSDPPYTETAPPASPGSQIPARARRDRRAHRKFAPYPKVWTNLSGVPLCPSLALIRSERYHVVITLLLTALFVSFIVIARLNIA